MKKNINLINIYINQNKLDYKCYKMKNIKNNLMILK